MTLSSAKSILLTAAFLFSLVAAGNAQATSQAGGGSSSGASIEGTWRVTVQLQDCTSGNPLGAPFPSLVTLARGGTQTETTANPNFYPAERSSGHGSWSIAGRDTYQAASTAFITLNGQLAKTQTITQRIQLDRRTDTWNSAAVVQFFDPSGNLVASGCAGATAVRFP
jgi:hypothetical protein